ncbi:hypothetical protein BC833DRAFT_656781 [Globomyces pollinis-pini]|nr:hypothetical protein BC833DRAFT_656781 [Globomyces pollinis-pini]
MILEPIKVNIVLTGQSTTLQWNNPEIMKLEYKDKKNKSKHVYVDHIIQLKHGSYQIPSSQLSLLLDPLKDGTTVGIILSGLSLSDLISSLRQIPFIINTDLSFLHVEFDDSGIMDLQKGTKINFTDFKSNLDNFITDSTLNDLIKFYRNFNCSNPNAFVLDLQFENNVTSRLILIDWKNHVFEPTGPLSGSFTNLFQIVEKINLPGSKAPLLFDDFPMTFLMKELIGGNAVTNVFFKLNIANFELEYEHIVTYLQFGHNIRKIRNRVFPITCTSTKLQNTLLLEKDQKINDIEFNLKQLQSDLLTKTDLFSQQKTLYEELLQTNAENDKIIADLKSKLLDLQETSQSKETELQQKIANMNKSLTINETQTNQKVHQLDEYNQKLSDYEDAIKDLTAKAEMETQLQKLESSKLNFENLLLKEANRKLNLQHTNLEFKSEDLHQQLDHVQKLLDSEEKKNCALSTKSNALEKEIVTLTSKLESNEKELSSLQKQYQELSENYKLLELKDKHEINILNTILKEKENLIEITDVSQNTLMTSTQTLSQELMNMKTLTDNLNNQNRMLSNDAIELKEKLNNLENSLILEKRLNEDLKFKLDELKSADSKLEGEKSKLSYYKETSELLAKKYDSIIELLHKQSDQMNFNEYKEQFEETKRTLQTLIECSKKKDVDWDIEQIRPVQGNCHSTDIVGSTHADQKTVDKEVTGTLISTSMQPSDEDMQQPIKRNNSKRKPKKVKETIIESICSDAEFETGNIAEPIASSDEEKDDSPVKPLAKQRSKNRKAPKRISTEESPDKNATLKPSRSKKTNTMDMVVEEQTKKPTRGSRSKKIPLQEIEEKQLQPDSIKSKKFTDANDDDVEKVTHQLIPTFKNSLSQEPILKTLCALEEEKEVSLKFKRALNVDKSVPEKRAKLTKSPIKGLKSLSSVWRNQIHVDQGSEEPLLSTQAFVPKMPKQYLDRKRRNLLFGDGESK